MEWVAIPLAVRFGAVGKVWRRPTRLGNAGEADENRSSGYNEHILSAGNDQRAVHKTSFDSVVVGEGVSNRFGPYAQVLSAQLASFLDVRVVPISTTIGPASSQRAIVETSLHNAAAFAGKFSSL